MPAERESTAEPKCSFCDKVVVKDWLVCGPRDGRKMVYICRDCISVCVAIISIKDEEAAARSCAEYAYGVDTP